jgi:hypothetical protein
MIEKLTEQRTIELADSASRIVRDPAFKRAVALVNEMYWEEWRNTAPGDAESRERLYQKALCLDDVVTALARVIGDGKVTADTRSRAKVSAIR